MRIPSLRELREYDAARPSFPGEHVAVTGVGAAALLMAARGSGAGTRPLTRLALGGLGLALLARGLSGRDGLAASIARDRSTARDAKVGTPFGTPSAPDPAAPPANTMREP